MTQKQISDSVTEIDEAVRKIVREEIELEKKAALDCRGASDGLGRVTFQVVRDR